MIPCLTFPLSVPSRLQNNPLATYYELVPLIFAANLQLVLQCDCNRSDRAVGVLR